MSLAEGVSARIAYKPYATGEITPGVEPDITVDPGADGGQILRRVSSSLTLNKDTYQSNEIRSDRQIADFRHGVKRPQGNISGELSPLTYGDFFQAACRGTWAVGVSLTESALTSVAADNATSKFTFGGGDPIALGLRVGHVVRFTDATSNDGENFVILGFGGTGNREVTVYPAPETQAADTAFTVTSAGKRLIVPSSGFVSRKFAIEIWNQDVDVARVFTECRCGGFNVQLPPTGLGTVDFDFMGRNMKPFSGVDAPFFTSPAAETTTGLVASVNGLLRVSGETVAVVTGLNIQMQLNPSADPVIGSDLVPEIFLGRANVTGQMTAFFENVDLINDFVNESEIEILAYLTTNNALNAPALTFYLPRVKLGGADLQTQGEGGQAITLPYQALKSTAVEASTGIPSTTIQIIDTEMV
ncbi:MAG: hypothetical protein GEU95_25335 [Rhizobiales bacterium]|nr:hypothetical protein [Hyphomicrobiales bacterium]